MPGPIFQREDTSVNGVFSSDRAKLEFTGTVKGVLVQGMNFTYAQQVTRLYEIGSDSDLTNIYYVGGRTQGTLQLNRVIGPNATIKELYSQYGDVCNAKDNPLELILEETDCGTGGGLAGGAAAVGGGGAGKMVYTLKFCVLIQVGVSLQAQDMVINEQSQIMFSGLDVD